MFISSQKFLPLYAVFLLLATFERIICTFFHKKVKPTKIVHHKWIFTVLFYSYIFIVLFSVGEYLLSSKNVNLAISILGVVTFGGGALLRRKAINDLGSNWSILTEIKEGHELITGGIYTVLKHPYYLAVLLELVGVCFISNAWYSLILIFIIQTPFLLIRISLEEKMLISYFGDAYRNYKESN